MTKILVAGDWHGNWQWAKKMIDVAVAEDIDTIYQVGDFGIWPGAAGSEYLLILSRYLLKQTKKTGKNKRIVWTPGNHEDYNQIDEWVRTLIPNEDGHIEIAPNIFYAGKVNSWTWYGKRFASVGGAASIDRRSRKLNESWWAQEVLTPKEIEKAKNLGRIDYLFTHDCPTMHPFNFLMEHLDSAIHRQHMTEIARELEPEAWFHGHYHYPAQYSFYHGTGSTQVYSLDADNRAAYDPSLKRHTVVLDVESGVVSSIDKLFNWHAKRFYFEEHK